MDELLRTALLLDLYAGILTTRQQEICRMHLQEDWSLGEIAEEMGISRQAVSDALRHSIQTMEKMESQLHAVQRFLKTRNEIDVMEQMLAAGTDRKQLLDQLRLIREAADPAAFDKQPDIGESNGI